MTDVRRHFLAHTFTRLAAPARRYRSCLVVRSCILVVCVSAERGGHSRQQLRACAFVSSSTRVNNGSSYCLRVTHGRELARSDETWSEGRRPDHRHRDAVATRRCGKGCYVLRSANDLHMKPQTQHTLPSVPRSVMLLRGRKVGARLRRRGRRQRL